MIGITGGIGSGKSTIAHELARRGFTVYDCDLEAKRIIAEDEAVQKAIIRLLGEEAFRETPSSQAPNAKAYNTPYVAKRVFADAALREALNAIVHPAVEKDIRSKQPDVVESAILYESGLDKLCERVIVVEAPEEVRIARTIARDYQGIDSEENINKVRARMRTQAAHQGDLQVCNDGKTPIAELVDNLTLQM